MIRLPAISLSLTALMAGLVPGVATAQSIGYGDVSQGGGTSAPDGASNSSRKSGGGSREVSVSPYIEVAQVVTANLSPGDEVFTYSRVAAGVDAVATNRRGGAAVSLRYERTVQWDGDRGDGELISGVANSSFDVAQGVRIEAGGLATRTRIQPSGSSLTGTFGDDDTVTQIYSIYAGPQFSTYAGDVALSAGYRIGYSKVEQADAFRFTPDADAVDTFDDSVVHQANVSATIKPGVALPVGVGVGGSYYREDVSNLDQRVEDMQANVTVTAPVTQSVALVGSVGYEKVEISSRDAVRDVDGDPVRRADGRFLTDKSSPRILAYDVDGLTWDAGVLWRPSVRTSLAAHVGRRYGSTSIRGTFSYAPNDRSSFNVGVYDNVAGFGGQLNRTLADLPTDFIAVRNPLTGDISGCVSSLDDGACLTGGLGSVRSSVFRARGISASYSREIGRLRAGLGAGYDRRKFIGAPGTVLESANGVIDEKYWAAAYLSGEIDSQSSFSTNFYANWVESGGSFSSDVTTLGAVAAYYRSLTDHLSASAALGVDGLEGADLLEDIWTASAQVGVRYKF